MNNVTIPLFRNILLTLYENGCVSIAPQGNVGVLADKTALFDDKGFSVGCTQYRYGVAYAYKNEPDLLEYLKSLDLQHQTLYNACIAQEQLHEQMRQHMGNFNFNF